MIPVCVKFDSASVEYQYEVEIDADRKAVVSRDKNGVMCVFVGSPTSYKPLHFLITEEAAMAMASAILDCVNAKPKRFFAWDRATDSVKDAIHSFIETRRHD